MTIVRMNRIRPAPDPQKPSQMAAALRPIYGAKGVEFIRHLRQFGHVTYTANMTGLTRHTFYQRRERDPEFAEAWDEALTAFEEELTMRVVQTALEMGTGKAPTMEYLAQQYFEIHAVPKKRPKSVAIDRSLMNRFVLPKFGKQKVLEIDHRDVQAFHNSLKRKPYLANRALSLLSKMFELSIKWGMRGDNPATGPAPIHLARLTKKYGPKPPYLVE